MQGKIDFFYFAGRLGEQPERQFRFRAQPRAEVFPEHKGYPGFDVVLDFSMRHQSLAYAHLSNPHMT